MLLAFTAALVKVVENGGVTAIVLNLSAILAGSTLINGMTAAIVLFFNRWNVVVVEIGISI